MPTTSLKVSYEQVRPLALITGASSGIGYELAHQFAGHGYDLLIVADNRARLDAAAASLSAMDEELSVDAIQADLSGADGVIKVYNAVKALGRPVDVLAANAGVGVGGDFAETDLDAEIALINLNVTSQVHLIKLIVFEMVDRGCGDILITSSVAATMPGPHLAVYAASKAFLRSFGQAIRYELKDTGVNVTVLMPGPTDTEFFGRADMLDTKVGHSPKQNPAEVAAAAFDALQSNSDHVVPGMKNKLQASMARLMTDEARAKLHGSQTRRDPR